MTTPELASIASAARSRGGLPERVRIRMVARPPRIGSLVASWRSTRGWRGVVLVRLEPLAAEHAMSLGEFLVSDDWPFYAGTLGQDLVTERLGQGYYDGPGRATFIVTDGPQQVGLVRVEDLDDPTSRRAGSPFAAAEVTAQRNLQRRTDTQGHCSDLSLASAEGVGTHDAAEPAEAPRERA